MSESLGIESKYISRLDIEGINEIKIIINNIKNHRQPFFIEIDTFRTLEHCGPSNDDHLGYRSKSEIQNANANDPLAKFEQSLLSQDSNFASKKAEKFIGIDIEIKSAFDFAENHLFQIQLTRYLMFIRVYNEFNFYYKGNK